MLLFSRLVGHGINTTILTPSLLSLYTHKKYQNNNPIHVEWVLHKGLLGIHNEKDSIINCNYGRIS